MEINGFQTEWPIPEKWKIQGLSIFTNGKSLPVIFDGNETGNDFMKVCNFFLRNINKSVFFSEEEEYQLAKTKEIDKHLSLDDTGKKTRGVFHYENKNINTVTTSIENKKTIAPVKNNNEFASIENENSDRKKFCKKYGLSGSKINIRKPKKDNITLSFLRRCNNEFFKNFSNYDGNSFFENPDMNLEKYLDRGKIKIILVLYLKERNDQLLKDLLSVVERINVYGFSLEDILKVDDSESEAMKKKQKGAYRRQKIIQLKQIENSDSEEEYEKKITTVNIPVMKNLMNLGSDGLSIKEKIDYCLRIFDAIVYENYEHISELQENE